MKYLRLIGLLVFLILLLHLDLPSVFTVLSRVRPAYILVAIALNGPMIGLKAWRWQSLLGIQDQRYPIWRAIVVYFSSLFAGFLTPGRLGEFVKALYVAQDTGMPTSEAMSSILVDRLFDLYALLISCGYGLIAFSLPPDVASTAQWMMIFVVGGSVLLLQPYSEKLICWTLEHTLGTKRRTSHLITRVHQFYAGIASLRKPKLIVAIMLTSAAYLLFFTQCYLLALGLNLPLDFGFITFAISTTSLAALVPVSISGLGTRDAILIALFGPLGIDAETAVAYSVLILVTFYVAAGIIGAIAWSATPMSFERIKQAWFKDNTD